MHSVQKALEPQAPLSAHLQPPQGEPRKETVSSYQGSDETPRHNPDQKISERSPRVLRLKTSAMAVENIRRPVRGGGETELQGRKGRENEALKKERTGCREGRT